eukprot:773376-Pleurochrysis_carterae.AAC.1
MITISTFARSRQIHVNCRRAPCIYNRQSRARFAVLQSHRMHICRALALRSPARLVENRSRWPPLPSERPLPRAAQ